MDGVLEGAVVLCLCKLTCSLLFLPSLAASYSSVSFCCCCLLIFTDFQVTVFLSLLCIFKSWLTDLSPTGDVIALRFLLFLSHTYGAVLLLSTFLIATETLIRLLWPHTVVNHRAVSPTVSGAQQCHVGEENVKKEDDVNGSDKDVSLHQVGGFFCCLSVWIIVALNVRWRWEVEEIWAVECLYTNDSLVRCLPNLLVSIPSAMNPCWSMSFIFVLLLLLIISPGLQRQYQFPGQMESTQREKHGDYWWQEFISVLSAPFKSVHPGMSVVEPKLCVDLEKTDSSCTGNTACSWNSVQMSTCHHGDFVLTSPDCFSVKRGGQEYESTKRGISLTFITEKHVDSPHSHCGRWWGFPSLEVNVMTGLVGVLSVFMLPFNLSVNILLIRTIDVLLEWCITTLLSSTRNTRDALTSHRVAQV